MAATSKATVQLRTDLEAIDRLKGQYETAAALAGSPTSELQGLAFFYHTKAEILARLLAGFEIISYERRAWTDKANEHGESARKHLASGRVAHPVAPLRPDPT